MGGNQREAHGPLLLKTKNVHELPFIYKMYERRERKTKRNVENWNRNEKNIESKCSCSHSH